MSRKAKGQQVGVALFPFLAVLICTMGALIVLLVLLVQQARVDATAIAAAKTGSANGDDRRVRERLEDAQWQRELLEKSRAEKTEELTETRSRVAHLEEHIQRLATQAKELLERAKAIDEGKKLREEDKAAARAEAAKLKAEIEKKKEELEKAKKKPQDGQEWYALIPYDGRAGTRRRPIYVECTEFGVIIQPEGILLRAEDFNGPLGPGNPLDSALRAIREHWEKTAGKQAAQPYPLLVVRPSGVVAFGAARAAISAWDDEWGYELISDDKNLDFGPPDPVLNASLSKSVAVSRQRQAAMVAMMPRRFQGEEPLRSFTPEPTIAAGAGRYIGGAGGGTGGGSGLGSAMGSGPGGSGGNGTAGSGTSGGTGGQPGGGGMARGVGGYGNGLGTGTGTNGGNGTTSGTGLGGAAGGQAAGMNRGGAGGYGAAGYGTGGTAGTGGYGSASGTGANGNGAGGSGVGGNGFGSSGTSGSGIPSVTGGLNGSNAGQSENLVGRNAASAIGGTGGGSGGDAFPGSTANGGGSGPGGSSYGTGSGQGGSGQAGAGGGGQSGTGGQSGGGQFGGSSSGQSFAGSGGGGQGGSSMGDSSSGGGGSSVGSAGGASSGGSSPFGGSSMSAGSSGGMGVPSLNFGGAKSAPSGGGGGKGGNGSPGSTAKRGKNWALPQTKQNQTGVTRHIRVKLQPDRVVMLPEVGDNRAPQVVKIAPELTPDDVTHFVNAVQSEVKGWGLAVADGYWKPVLQVDVTPGAERQYMNLETALHGSGIEITRR